VHALLRPLVLFGALLTLIPVLGAAFFPACLKSLDEALSPAARIAGPSLLCIPYALIAISFGIFHWGWLALYALLPAAVAFVMSQAKEADPAMKSNWRDFAVLAILGVAVDLRWFEPAWPAGLAAVGKLLLLDAGIFGFLVVRQLDGVGFDLRLTLRDAGIALREFRFYAPIAILLGWVLGFLHFHAVWPAPLPALGAFLFNLLCIAVPEELFFRGWLQNLLERRLGRTVALLLTAVLFGLAHWNKRTALFNWRYVLLAAIAGVFYGRAWRDQRRVGASSLTHSMGDTVWSLWLR